MMDAEMAEMVKDADEGGAAGDAEMEDGKKPEEVDLEAKVDPDAEDKKEEEGKDDPAVPAENKDETAQPEAAEA